HADVDVAGGGELLDGQLQQAELGRRVGQVGRVDLLLRLEQLRQVRVAVDRQPVRAHLEHGVQGAGEALEVLLRQAVDQVDVDRAEAAGPAGIYHGAGF